MGLRLAIRQDIPAEELRRLARQESNGRVACRLLGVANALDGMSRGQAARQAGMDRQTLRDWVIRFNTEGVEGLRDRPKSGRPPRLDEGQLAAFKALVLRGPDPERDGVSTWRAQDLCRMVEARFGVLYSENGMLRLLHDLDLSWQKARPIHPDADRKAQEELKKNFPALIAEVARDHPEAERLEVWFLDEARVGQTGRVCRRWYQKGLRPRGVRDLRHQAVYLFGAVCPERDAGVALVLPTVSAGAMQLMLDELSQAVAPNVHAVVLMDRAGWHIATDLTIPANLTLLFLPPYSPELNAIERVWLYLRDRFLSHRLWPAYDDILDACCAAWNALLDETDRIRSLCALDWATVSS
jgi:transposase